MKSTIYRCAPQRVCQCASVSLTECGELAVVVSVCCVGCKYVNNSCFPATTPRAIAPLSHLPRYHTRSGH